MQSLERSNTQIDAGMEVYHNYVRLHETLDGKTPPSEIAGIKVQDENEWLTLIQNASSPRNRMQSLFTKLQ